MNRATGASRRSRYALDATSFFLAQVTGLATPFLADYLRERGWSYGRIGIAAAMSALGVLIVQTPVGVLVDCLEPIRGAFVASTLVVGACYAAVPLLPARPLLVDPILFASGIAQAFFAPLLAAVALGLAGHEKLNRTLGVNQAWNHAGNVAAGLLAYFLVSGGKVGPVFFAIAAITALAALSVALIRGDELDVERSCGGGATKRAPLRALLRDRRVVVLLVASGLFHLANASVLPLVALRVKDLHGSDREVAALVVAAQAVMIPAALLAGFLCDRSGRKPVFTVGFFAAPIGILLMTLVRNPIALIAVQGLEGVGLGVFGVAIVAVAADIARGKGRFNALNGATATALALGSVVGPFLGGYAYGALGYTVTFLALAATGLAGAVLFAWKMPETRPETPLRARRAQAILREGRGR